MGNVEFAAASRVITSAYGTSIPSVPPAIFPAVDFDLQGIAVSDWHGPFFPRGLHAVPYRDERHCGPPHGGQLEVYGLEDRTKGPHRGNCDAAGSTGVSPSKSYT